MIKDITFFENTKELEKLTGLSHTELWDNGFNLDDMDWGFVINENFMVEEAMNYYRVSEKAPDYIRQILSWMENYCMGYYYTEYNGKHYYTLHHA